MTTSIRTRIELTVLLSCIAASGNPLLSNNTASPVILAAILIVLFGLGVKTDMLQALIKRYLLIAACFLLIIFAHYLQFGVVSELAAAFLLAKILIGGLTIAYFGANFPQVFFRCTSILASTSLASYGLLVVLGPDAITGIEHPEFLGPNLKSLVIHTIHVTDEWWRNSGMMWEPGAFQGIINLSLAMIPAKQLLQKNNRLPIFIHICALVTTFSTTGYLTFFLIAVFKAFELDLKTSIKVIIASGFTIASLIAVFQVDFLGDKIKHQISNINQTDEFSPDRFGAMYFDLHYIQKNPIFGNGQIEETRYADHPQLFGQQLGHGNGLSNFVASYGLFGLMVYCVGILTSGLMNSLSRRSFILMVLLVIIFGEQFLGFPLFLGLMLAQSRKGVGQTDSGRYDQKSTQCIRVVRT